MHYIWCDSVYRSSMNVMLIIRNFNFGGAENHVCDLANALVDEGVNVFLVAGKGRQSQRLDNRVKLFTLCIKAHKGLWQIPHLIFLLYKYKIDVVHAHQRTSAWFGVVAGAVLRKPVFFSIHGRISRELRSPVIRRGITNVIVFSTNNLNRLKQISSLNSKVLLIRGVILRSELNPKSYSGSPSIGYISRIDEKHGAVIEILIKEVWPRFIQRFPDAQLHIVGDGSSLSDLKCLVRQFDDEVLFKSVVFHGFVHNVSSLYGKLNLVMGVGRVATDALLNGIPVLSVKYGRLGEIITTSNFERLFDTNFVDTQATGFSPDKMFDLLADFFSNQTFYQKEADKISQNICDIFGRKNCIQPLISAYYKAIQKPCR